MSKRSSTGRSLTGIGRLTELLPVPGAPAGVPTQSDCRSAEVAIGRKLPDGYCEFVGRYGAGCIDDFIRIFVPNSTCEQLNIVSQQNVFRRMLRSTLSFDLSVGPLRLDDAIAFGETDNGDVLFWEAGTIIVYYPRDASFFEYQGNVCQFLIGVLSGSIRVTVFPKDFPSRHPEFKPIA